MPVADEGLLEEAGKVRNAAHGSRITYSPKVFIPLTKLCRDRCGYCTFAQPPARLESPYLSESEVLAIARSGAEAGCHEALFTLGEAPEDRYRVAADWLSANGYESTVAYAAAMAARVTEETGLLVHGNLGALDADSLALLRTVCPSQGMMVESLRDDLDCHDRCPDKDPKRRLETLDLAGELQIPFTTGILVGIGENRRDRVAAFEAIASSHGRHGHVQEVIVQNFLPKRRTAMAQAKPCPTEDFIDAIALARLILPPEVHIQAPPNLSEDFGALLDAGIDDWGGVSPVTADHVNPERPWPALELIRSVTESRGFRLAPRLTAHPSFVADPERWFDPDLGFAVVDRSDSQGLGRDDDLGWYSGAPVDPPELLKPKPQRTDSQARLFSKPSSAVAEVLDDVASGRDIDSDGLVTLLGARGSDVTAVADAADSLRQRLVGDDVTWVENCNINYTNVCTFKCRFCGFSKGPLSLNLRGNPYLLSLDDISEVAAKAYSEGATEVCLQGGIHPNFDGDYYVDVTRAVKQAAPGIHIHGFTALEVFEGARRLDESLASYLARLRDAGLRTLPGTAAEILDDDVRTKLCGDKIDTETWLEVHRVAHSVGLRSNVTMMFGSIEAPIHQARHLLRTRDLQDETSGFTEFVGLPFVHMAAPIYLQGEARRGPTFRETLLLHAVARIAYAGSIPNIQASWVKVGLAGVAQLLNAGVNDLGGTLRFENISRAAGAEHGQVISAENLAGLVEPLGRRLVQRNTLYEKMEEPAVGAA